MKRNILGLLFAGLAVCSFTSCDDYFDDVPNNATSLEDVFSNRGQTLGWLTNIYGYIPDNTNRYAGGTAMFWGPGTLEGYLPWDWVETHDIIHGSITPGTGFVSRIWQEYYRGIQYVNIFLANVDGNDALTDMEKAQTKAEARALRAFFYFNLLKEYGPVPIVGDQVYGVADPLDGMMIARSSVDECFDYVISEYTDVLNQNVLFSTFDDNGARQDQMNGSFTQEVVDALRAEAYLYRASYMYNGDPYFMNLANADGKKLFPQARDDQKWRDARDAAKSIIDSGKYRLVYRTASDAEATDISKACAIRSVFYASMANSKNEELIFGRTNSSNETYSMVPRFDGLGSNYDKGGGAYTIPLQFVDLYFTKNGKSIEYDNTDHDGVYFLYDTDDPQDLPARNKNSIVSTAKCTDALSSYEYFSPASGSYAAPTSVMKQFYDREPRFYLAVTFQNRPWDFDKKTAVQMQYSGNSGPNGSTHDYPIFGTICRKLYYAKAGDWPMSMVLRLGEVYLNYAEACAELGDTEEALKYVNLIRNRAGIPAYKVNSSDSGKDALGLDKIPLCKNNAEFGDTNEESYDKETVLKAVYRERILELAYECKHYFDVRRWGVADGHWRTNGPEMTDGWIYPSYHKGGEGGDMLGFNVMNAGVTDANKNVNFYKRRVQETRVFTKRMSLFPIPQNEINRNKLCVQNPDWFSDEEVLAGGGSSEE